MDAFARDFALRDQMRRAALSVMSNIAEGFERDGTRELLQFLSIAKGSAAEAQSQLYVAVEQGYLGKEEFEVLYELADETKRLLGGFMRYLRSAAIEGHKFRQDPQPTRNSKRTFRRRQKSDTVAVVLSVS